MTSFFETTTAVEPLGEGRFRAQLHADWWVVRGPHGGYLAATILRALTGSLNDPDRPIRSFTTHFMAAPAAGPMDIVTRLERAGRSMTFMTARAEQEGKPIATALAAFSTDWKGLEFDNAPMPEAASLEDAFPNPVEGEGIPAFLGNFDMRWALGERPFTGAAAAVVGGWMKMREPVVADEHVVACLLDAWAPAVFPVTTTPLVAPTIDLTMHFRSPLPLPNATEDDFYLGRFSSSLGRDGFFEEDGAIWTADGKLIAQSRQLALGLI